MMPNYIIPTFSENDLNLVSWHLTYVDMTRFSHFLKLDKIKSVNSQKRCHEWNRSIVYIFVFFNNSTEILASSAERGSSGRSQDRYGHMSTSRDVAPEWRSLKNNRQIIKIIWPLFLGNIIFLKIMNFGFTTDLVFLTCRHRVHRLTDES